MQSWPGQLDAYGGRNLPTANKGMGFRYRGMPVHHAENRMGDEIIDIFYERYLRRGARSAHTGIYSGSMKINLSPPRTLTTSWRRRYHFTPYR